MTFESLFIFKKNNEELKYLVPHGSCPEKGLSHVYDLIDNADKLKEEYFDLATIKEVVRRHSCFGRFAKDFISPEYLKVTGKPIDLEKKRFLWVYKVDLDSKKIKVLGNYTPKTLKEHLKDNMLDLTSYLEWRDITQGTTGSGFHADYFKKAINTQIHLLERNYKFLVNVSNAEDFILSVTGKEQS